MQIVSCLIRGVLKIEYTHLKHAHDVGPMQPGGCAWAAGPGTVDTTHRQAAAPGIVNSHTVAHLP
jgi:hypothetical protein